MGEQMIRRGRRRGKYGAIRTEVDGISFMSRAESRRYVELRARYQAGEIGDLVLQPKYPIVIDGQHICWVILDFSYYELPSNRFVIEDVKGVDTAISKLKRKLFENYYGMKVEVIKNGSYRSSRRRKTVNSSRRGLVSAVSNAGADLAQRSSRRSPKVTRGSA